MSGGIVRSIKSMVVTVLFDEDLPESGEILLTDSPKKSVLLVDHLADNNIAVCLNVLADNSLEKNMSVQRTGKGIEIPVGSKTIGRSFDALARPLDGQP